MKQTKKKRSSGFSVMLAAALLGAALFLPRMWSIQGGGIGAFSFYSGPILPMTAVSGGEGIEAERRIDLDFSGYAPGTIADDALVTVTDTYRLTNTTDTVRTLELACPVFASPAYEDSQLPVLTVNEAAIDATLHALPDSGSALHNAESFDDWQTAMTEADFCEAAHTPVPAPDTPVRVYRIRNFSYTGPEDPAELRVGIIYSRGESTTVWKYGTMDMVENEELGIDYLLPHMPDGEASWVMDEAWLIVLGPDVANLAIRGYRAYEDISAEAMVEGVRADVEQFDSTFGEIIRQLSEQYLSYTPYEPHGPRVTAEFLTEGVYRRLADPGYHTQITASIHSLSELFAAVESEEQLIYSTFSLTLAPGETAAVTVRYQQNGSLDNGGFFCRRDGFDLATKLGSSLTFTAQSAALSGAENIRILDQNFGFDLEKGVTEVILNMDTERYYLTVTGK